MWNDPRRRLIGSSPTALLAAMVAGIQCRGSESQVERREELGTLAFAAINHPPHAPFTEDAPPHATLLGAHALVWIEGRVLPELAPGDPWKLVIEGAAEVHRETAWSARIGDGSSSFSLELAAPERRGDRTSLAIRSAPPKTMSGLATLSLDDGAHHVELPLWLTHDSHGAICSDGACLAPAARLELEASIEAARAAPAEHASEAWSQVAEQATRAGVVSEVSRAYRASAFSALMQRDYDLADQRLEQARAIDDEIDDRRGALRESYYRALLEQEQGRYRSARDRLRHALRDASELALEDEVITLVKALAALLSDLGLDHEAMARLESVRESFVTHRSESYRLSFFVDYGWVALRAAARGLPGVRVSEARASLERALELASELDMPLRAANILANLAWAAQLEGDTERAFELLAQMDSLDPERDGHHGRFADLLEGELYLGEGEWSAAEQAFVSAEQRAWVELGSESDYTWRALYGRGRARRARSSTRADQREALRLFGLAIDSLERVAASTHLRAERAPFVRARQSLFRDALETALALDRTDTAVEFALRGHGMVLRALDARLRIERLSDSRRTEWESALARYRDARDRHEAGRASRDAVAIDRLAEFDRRVEEDRRLLGEEFERAFAILDEESPPPAVPSLHAIRAHLGTRQALALFVEGSTGPVSILVSSEGVAIETEGGPELTRWERGWESIDRLYIVADAPSARNLHTSRDSDGRLWLERFQIAYLPQVSALLRRSKPEEIGANGHPAVVIADPDGTLPFARVEGERVGAALSALTLFGSRASRERVLESIRGAPIVHFAGHGRVRDWQTWDAHLVLADGETLDVEDLLVERPAIGLAVLSGCHTADLVATDERLGVAEAFVIGGAEAVLAAEGDLNDREALEFIERFYAHGGARAPIEAYRVAALESERRASPVWRAFRLLASNTESDLHRE